MDDLPAFDYRPLDERDLLTLAAMRATGGKRFAKVDRELLSRLLCERVLLSATTESARWLVEEVEEFALEREPKDFVAPTQFEKAIAAVRHLLDAVDDLGTFTITGESC
jgi:hypothetical protein